MIKWNLCLVLTVTSWFTCVFSQILIPLNSHYLHPHIHTHTHTHSHTSTHTNPPTHSYTHTQLKRQFGDFIFPKLPGKRPFALNETQVDTRRRGLEDYLDKVCSARVIFESDLLQDFLEIKKSSSMAAAVASVGEGKKAEAREKKVDFRVTLPDHSVTTVTIEQHARTPEVFNVSCVCVHVLWP